MRQFLAEQSRAEQSRAERNNYIDFLRGIASIGIIAIHTAFWSGQSYTPEWFWNLTLLLDVPFFFYLSGWASSYKKSDIKKLVKVYLTYGVNGYFLFQRYQCFVFFLIFFRFLLKEYLILRIFFKIICLMLAYQDSAL